MNVERWLCLILMVVGCGFAHPQASTRTKRALSQDSPAKAVDALVNRFEHEVTNAAKAMPAEKYEFTPASLHIQGSDFATVRTFAQQVKHIAQANYAIAGNLTGGDRDPEINAIGKLVAKSDILAALSASFLAVHQGIATITPENQNDVIGDSGVGPNQTKESEAAWVAVHGYDHYGQMIEYLRMNGIKLNP